MSNQNELTPGELKTWLVQFEKENARIDAKIREFENLNGQWEKTCVWIGLSVGIPLGWVIKSIVDVILK